MHVGDVGKGKFYPGTAFGPADYEIITNVKQRDFKRGKPAIMVNLNKFIVKKLCPDPITVPVGVEAVWALVTPRRQSSHKF